MSNRHWILLFGALLWFGAVFGLAARRVFISGPNERPIKLAVAFITPILLFLPSVRWFSKWRALVVSISPVFLIALNGWRFIGLGFLMGYAEGLLPGGFAWPAGLGDIAMAATTPWIAARVAADDRFRFGRVFLAWNMFGIPDFLGTLVPMARISLVGDHGAHAGLAVCPNPWLFCAIGSHGTHHTFGAAAVTSPSSPRHRCGSQHAAIRVAEVCTRPILSPVPMGDASAPQTSTRRSSLSISGSSASRPRSAMALRDHPAERNPPGVICQQSGVFCVLQTRRTSLKLSYVQREDEFGCR